MSEQPPEADVLEPVYRWLLDESFPFDWHPLEKPPWLDVDRLAAMWAERDGETAEDYKWTIFAETGWEE